MNILIPILGFGRAGGNRVLSQLANKWIQAGHKVDFLVPSTSALPYFPTNAGIIWIDVHGRATVQERPTSEQARESGWRNLLSLWRGLGKFGREYDVLLANHSFTAWPVALAPVKGRRFYYIQAYEPEYYEITSQHLHKLVSKLSYFLPLVPIANAPIYCNYREIKANYWVPPGLDLKNFSPKKRNSQADPSPVFVLGCIGRSEPTKGTKYVLEAFELLHNSDSTYRLKVAYGNLPEGYSHPAVEIILPANDRELADFYRSVDVIVAAGTVQHGAAHYPVLEAMACGVPVITTGYLPASTDNAWIVPNRDAHAIAAAVIEITAGASVRPKVRRALVDVASYSWEAVAARMIKVFQAIPREYSADVCVDAMTR